MGSYLPESEPEIDRTRFVGEDDEPGAKEKEIRLRQNAHIDLSKITSSRLVEFARHKYGSAMDPGSPASSVLSIADDESVINEDEDPDCQRLSSDGEDLSDIEDDPRFVDYLK